MNAPLTTHHPPRRPALGEPFSIGPVEVSNRVLLAPLAGIGNWFVRLQAHRHGAGMAFSEMVSSFAIHHRNRRTLTEMLRIHPDEGPVAIQLFGSDPDVMRSAAATVAEAGPDLIDLNMGCPVPKVVKNGAGAALLDEHERALAVARAAAEGSGLPVTVKLRSGLRPGDRSGLELARRLVADAGVAAIAFHPRAAIQHHAGSPDYELVRELVETLDADGGGASRAPVIVSGGMRTAEGARRAHQRSAADAVMIARGALGNPWIFGELTGGIQVPAPERGTTIAELRWVIDRGEEHWGAARAARNLRKFYPWYLERLGIAGPEAHRFQRADGLDRVREMVDALEVAPRERALDGRTGAPAHPDDAPRTSHLGVLGRSRGGATLHALRP